MKLKYFNKFIAAHGPVCRRTIGCIKINITMVRRLTLVLVTGLSACAGLVRGPDQALVLGEHAAYRIINLSTQLPRVDMPKLQRVDGGQYLYATLHAMSESPVRPHRPRQGVRPVVFDLPPLLVGNRTPRLNMVPKFEKDPGREVLSLPAAAVGTMAVAPHGHRVPETLALSWRALPEPGQAAYAGAAVAPTMVAIRSSIPPSVLARVRDQWRYRLDIEVALTDSAPQVRWRLLCFTDDAVHEIQRGGYVSDNASSRMRLPYRSSGTVNATIPVLQRAIEPRS